MVGEAALPPSTAGRGAGVHARPGGGRGGGRPRVVSEGSAITRVFVFVCVRACVDVCPHSLTHSFARAIGIGSS